MSSKWVRYRTKHSYGDSKWGIEVIPDMIDDVKEFVQDSIPMSEIDGDHYRGFEFVVIDESDLTVEELIGLIDGFTESIKYAFQRVAYCEGARIKMKQLLAARQQEAHDGAEV